MSYSATQTRPAPCCSGCARGASKCMGDSGAVTVAPGGAAPPTIDPMTVLRAQVNRFWGASTPTAYRFGPDSDKLPTTGPLDVALAIRAVLIVQKRAAEAYGMDPEGAADLLAKANQGFSDPVGWVTKNFDMVLQTVTIYGDIHGVPKATLPGQALGVSTPLLVGLGIVALGAIYLLRRG